MQNIQDLEHRKMADPSAREYAEEPKQMEVDIVELLYHLVDKLPQILIVSVLCAALIFSWVFFFTSDKYEATTKLYVLSNGISSQLLSEFQIGNYLTNDYRQVFMNKEVHDQVLKKLDLEGKYSYRDLQNMLSITNPSDTRIMVLTITSTDEKEAYQMAEEYASAAEDFIENRMGGTLPEKRFQKVYVERVSKHVVQNTLIGFAVGLLVMAAIYSIAFVLDDRITSSDFIEKRVGIVTLGMMPLVDQGNDGQAADGKKKNDRK